MKTVNTGRFGEVSVSDDKVIVFPTGIIGFPDLKNFALIHDIDSDLVTVQFLQSLDDGNFAMPVVDPQLVTEGYHPSVHSEIESQIGTLRDDGFLMLVTLTIPKDVTKMSVNLQAPIIVNSDTHKAVQTIVDETDYRIKHPIYDYLEKKRDVTK